MTWAVFYTLNRQRDLGDTTHKILNISNITNTLLNMFYLSPDDIKSDMKLFFADHFPLLPVLGFTINYDFCLNKHLNCCLLILR